MNEITVSINPSYFCNFSCDFCYLTPEQLQDQKKIHLNDLDSRLNEISKHRKIDWIDLYGGEIGALKKDYFYGLRDVIRKYYDKKINIITNFSMLHEGFFEDDFYLSISYDFDAREKSNKVYQNMLQSKVPIAVLILASQNVIRKDVSEMITLLNMCSSITSVEIKPYSINQANQHNVSHKDFEDFIKKWINNPIEKRFEFRNLDKIIDSYHGNYNAFSNNHVYITPNAKFAVLEFDDNDREYFLELDNFNDYMIWADKEKDGLSDICKSCKYYGKCLTEHYRYVKDLINGCNGYKGLQDYYEGMENKTGNIS